ncbi:MAG: hypothetical protein CL908_05350 [Deltaproteobacteria bacterium]|nr:hypothetical protein [Deltaproteobacteria bacterium]
MRSRGWVIGLLVLAALACGEPAAESPASPSQDDSGWASSVGRRRVILILLDAARLDRFGYAGYSRPTTPVMDRLGAGGMVFLNHYAHATHTRKSLPNLLYSRYFLPSLFPSSSAVPFDTPANLLRRPDPESVSLPRLLMQTGFATAAISAHSWIKPGTRIAGEFQELQDLAGELHRYSPPAEIAVDRSIEWIDRHRGEDVFLYLHLMDTHFPHGFGADAREFFGADRYSGGRVTGGVAGQDTSQALMGVDRRYMDALYDGSLRSVDRQIGRLVEFLKREDMFDDTLIAITSDHGDHLLELPERFTHGGPWFETLARIPLIISYPTRFEEAIEVESFSELVDVAPTILGLLDLPMPAEKVFDGRNQLAVAQGRAAGSERVLSLHGIREGRYKLLLENPREFLSSNGDPADESVSGALFDLEEDPNEQHDLWSDEPEVVERLLGHHRSALHEPYRRFLAAVNHEQPKLPFAIASKHFEAAHDFVEAPRDSGPRRLQKMSQPGQWLRSRRSSPGWILAREGAAPLPISFAIPSGAYEVVVHAAGGGAIRLGGNEPIPLEHPTGSGDGRAVPTVVGVTRVDDEQFRAELIPPTDGSWLKVTMLGFRPMEDQQAGLEAIDEEHLEQLRALGYVE